MKLRHDKGKPLIVLEQGDVSALDKTVGLLDGIIKHVGKEDAIAECWSCLVHIRDGLYDGVQLPKKRAKQVDDASLLDACGSMPDDGEDSVETIRKMRDGDAGDHPAAKEIATAPSLARKTGPKCAKCNELLSKGELRHERDTCFNCEPVEN